MKIKIILNLILFLGLNEFIFAQQSYPITFEHDGKTVFGTFTTPDGSGRFPAIIINPGSGPNDRDGTILLSGGNVECLYPDLNGEILKPYKELSDALVDSGFAVLRYDKLEFTYPSTLGPITFHKLWLPVESAIDYVKSRTDVDTNRIILLGHSEGSSLIPFIAKGRTDIRALISIAGARTPFDSILAYQLVYFAQFCEGDTVLAKNQAENILDYFWNVRVGLWSALPPLFGVPASAWNEYVKATDSVAINYNLNNLPTLFLGLGLDVNVPPAELIRFQNEVHITDDFWSIPGLIHFMAPSNDPHVSMTLTDTIVYWLRHNNLLTGISNIIHEDDLFDVNPNPFQESISISIQKSYKNATYSVFNVCGQKVAGMDLPKDQYWASIDLSSLISGIYILEFVLDDNRTIQKIVKR